MSGASTLRSAGTLVWDGGRGDANWNTYSGTAANQSNWNLNNIPATTLVDNLEFAGSTQLTSTNNIIGLTVGSIAFNSGASAFTVGGNAITLNSGVTNNSANLQTVNLPITLGAAQTINAASGDLALGGTIANGGFLLSVDGANNSTISQAVSGNGGLSKTGSGTLTLGGTNTYTGTTTIANGTLTLASTGSIASNTSVAGGATLSFDNGAELTGDVGVSGTLTGAVNVDGNVTINASGTLTGDALITGDLAMNGSLSPGASPGYVLASNVYFGDSASTLMEIESLSSFDLVEAENSMSYDGALTIDISGTYAEGSSFDLFDFAGTALGDFNSISLTGDYGSIPMTGAGTWTATLGGTLFTFTGSTGVLSLSAQAIPEPLTAAGVMLLASRVLGRRARVSL